MHNSSSVESLKKPPLPALTGIRFFAALWVLLFHLHAAALSAGHGLSATWLRNVVATGYSGVSLFFELSGFILTYNYLTLDTHGPRLQQYWVARGARILPVYLLGLALDAPFAVSSVLKTGVHATNMAWIVGLLLASVLLVQAWIPSMALGWNGPGWSLSDEAFFYSVFPYALRRIRTSPTWALLGLLVVFQIAALVPPWCALAANIPGFSDASASELTAEGNWLNFIQFFPSFRLPEFQFGVVLGVLFSRPLVATALARFASALAIVGLVGVLGLCGFASAEIPHVVFHNGLLLAPFGALIFGLAFSGSAVARLFSGKWLETLGCASYALYIIHVPVIHYFQAVQKRLHWTADYSGYEIMALVVLPVALSVAILHLYEEPARKWIMQRWRDRTVALNRAET